MINSCPRDNMQRLCELFPNNYNSQGGRGFDQTVISNFAPSRLVGDPIFSSKYCTSRVLYRSRTITRSTCNAADKNSYWKATVKQLCSKSFELRAGNRYEKKGFSFKNFLLLWKYEKISNLDTTNRRIIGERINPINDRKIDRG